MKNFILIAIISLLGAVSPGPNFSIILRNSLVYSRKIGSFTAMGVALAVLIHLSYTFAGLGLLILNNHSTYLIIKYLGTFYLFYLGITGAISSFKKTNDSIEECYTNATKNISSFKAFSQGFLTNLLNPRAAFFFASLYAQFIISETSLLLRMEYGLINWVVTVSWYYLLIFLITGKKITTHLIKFRNQIDRTLSCFLILLSINMWLIF